MRKFLPILLLATTVAAGALFAQQPAPTPPATTAPPAFWSWAETPTLGWNSWDCFGAGVNEEQTLANAEYMQKNLKSYGYDLITVDIQWYEPQARTTNYRAGAVLEMDANGRLLPAGNRFPSAAESRSFKPLADKIHAMGLRFGIHLMRGIPRQAVDRDNCPILGTNVKAADIADKKNICRWNTDMYGVDMSKPGAQEYYDSVFALIASWDVDFVKVDDLSAPNYHEPEVTAIRKAIDKTRRKMVLSTSPGATPVASGPHVSTHANQWRISDDFWDDWAALKSQFARLDAWTPYRGPGHFPDADMLPVGALRQWTPNGWTRFTQDEQVTLMTLWSIARSPLIIGGHMPRNDEFTLRILTNDEVLAVNQKSTNNRQLYRREDLIAWVADEPGTPNKYVALFNAKALPNEGRGRGRGRGAASQPASAPAAAPAPATVAVTPEDLGIPAANIAAARDLWNHKDVPLSNGTVSATLLPHQAAIFKLTISK
jgi:hypothetical protein